jgi:hypothetical protein
MSILEQSRSLLNNLLPFFLYAYFWSQNERFNSLNYEQKSLIFINFNKLHKPSKKK